ncbi:hypothetical protein [Streptomyces sp. NPDC020951]
MAGAVVGEEHGLAADPAGGVDPQPVRAGRSPPAAGPWQPVMSSRGNGM